MPKSSAVAKQLQSVRASLRRLERDLRRLVPVLARATQASIGMPEASGPRRKLRLSPARRSALELQGRYLGYMRQLKAAQKARVKGVRMKKGMRAAIAMARKMGKG